MKQICEALGIPCAATDISEEAFMNAEEVFTATTAGGPVPVTRVNGRIFGNDAIGPLIAKILHTYWEWHKCEDLALKICYAPTGHLT